MGNELDQIVTFGPGVKAFRIVVDTADVTREKTDVAKEKTDSQIVRTENAKRLGDQLRAGLVQADTVSK